MKTAKLNLYVDSRGEWRWQVVASNGRIIAEGGEGYQRKSSMLRTLQKLFCTAGLSTKVEAAIEAERKFVEAVRKQRARNAEAKRRAVAKAKRKR